MSFLKSLFRRAIALPELRVALRQVERRRIEGEALHLLDQCAFEFGWIVAEDADAVAAVEIKVTLAALVNQFAAFGAFERDGVRRITAKQW